MQAVASITLFDDARRRPPLCPQNLGINRYRLGGRRRPRCRQVMHKSSAGATARIASGKSALFTADSPILLFYREFLQQTLCAIPTTTAGER
ncbi:MAG: hypothetical protein ACFNTM_00915 [Cardiobacterium sp.]